MTWCALLSLFCTFAFRSGFTLAVLGTRFLYFGQVLKFLRRTPATLLLPPYCATPRH